VLVALVVLAAGVALYRSLSGHAPLGKEIRFFCVATGRIYWVDRQEIDSLPVRNPETGELSLLPCIEGEDGLSIDPHYRGLVEELGEMNRYVNVATLAVSTR